MAVPESDLFARIKKLEGKVEKAPLFAGDAPTLALRTLNLLKICQEVEKLSRPVV